MLALPLLLRAQPPNNTCANALPLAVGGSVTSTNQGATAETLPACSGTVTTFHTVWYKLAGTGHSITLSTCGGTNFDTQLWVYSGTCGALVPVACNNNDNSCSYNRASTLSFQSTHGTDYYVRVGGVLGARGTFALSATGVIPGFCGTGSISYLPGALLPVQPGEGIGGVSADPIYIRIYVHALRKSDGTGGLSNEKIKQALAYLHSAFSPHNIFFVRDCGEPIPLLNDTYYYNDSGDEINADAIRENMFAEVNHTDGIDIILADDGPDILYKGAAVALDLSALLVSGFMASPLVHPSAHHSVTVSNVLSHEVGHVLGLFHTHYGTGQTPFSHTPSCPELINGDAQNRMTCGDFVIDTPADGNLAFNTVNSSCVQVSQLFEPGTGLPYMPLLDNIMSYSAIPCLRRFTQGQEHRMRQVIDAHLQSHLATPVSDIQGSITSPAASWTVSNTPNGGDFVVDGDLVIHGGAKLTIGPGVTVRFRPGNKVIVKPSGQLVLKGARLEGVTCDLPWQGIEVWGDNARSQDALPRAHGTLTAQANTVIKNAVTGVKLYGPGYGTHAGGIIFCQGTTFLNNATAVEFAPYENFAPAGGLPHAVRPYRGRFHDCTFTVDNCYHHSDATFYGMRLTGVRGISIEGCTFRNLRTLQGGESEDAWGYGIHATDAGFSAGPACLANPTQAGVPCPANETAHCLFENLGYGIHLAQINVSRPVWVEGATFKNCFVGLRNRGANGMGAVLNHFVLDQLPSTAVTNTLFGMVLEGEITGWTVEANDFVSNVQDPAITKIGTFCKDTGKMTKLIRKNQYTNLSWGNLANGLNASVDETDLSGLLYLCNENEGWNGAPFEEADFGVAPGGTVHLIQGEPQPISTTFRAAGNTFVPSGTLNKWNFINGDVQGDMPSPNTITYHFANQPGQMPVLYFGVVLPGVVGIPIPSDPNPCAITYCDKDCLTGPGDIPALKAEYHNKRAAYPALQADYAAAPTEAKAAVLAHHRAVMDANAMRVVTQQLYDTLGHHRDTLLTWLGLLESPAGDFWLAGEQIVGGDTTAALQTVAQIPLRHTLTPGQDSAVVALGSLLAGLSGQSVYAPDSAYMAALVAYAYQKEAYASRVAQNILNLRGWHFPVTYVLPQVPPSPQARSVVGQSTTVPSLGHTHVEGSSIIAVPNPATTQVSFQVNLREGTTDTQLLVFDLSGREVARYAGFAPQGTLHWDVSDLAPGLYLYQLRAGGLAPITGRVAIHK